MKKAQAIMEFLMTYGWAILIVLAGISALAYYEVIPLDGFQTHNYDTNITCNIKITQSYAYSFCKEQGFDKGWFSSLSCENGIQCHRKITTKNQNLEEYKCFEIL